MMGSPIPQIEMNAPEPEMLAEVVTPEVRKRVLAKTLCDKGCGDCPLFKECHPDLLKPNPFTTEDDVSQSHEDRVREVNAMMQSGMEVAESDFEVMQREATSKRAEKKLPPHLRKLKEAQSAKKTEPAEPKSEVDNAPKPDPHEAHLARMQKIVEARRNAQTKAEPAEPPAETPAPEQSVEPKSEQVTENIVQPVEVKPAEVKSQPEPAKREKRVEPVSERIVVDQKDDAEYQRVKGLALALLDIERKGLKAEIAESKAKRESAKPDETITITSDDSALERSSVKVESTVIPKARERRETPKPETAVLYPGMAQNQNVETPVEAQADNTSNFIPVPEEAVQLKSIDLEPSNTQNIIMPVENSQQDFAEEVSGNEQDQPQNIIIGELPVSIDSSPDAQAIAESISAEEDFENVIIDEADSVSAAAENFEKEFFAPESENEQPETNNAEHIEEPADSIQNEADAIVENPDYQIVDNYEHNTKMPSIETEMPGQASDEVETVGEVALDAEQRTPGIEPIHYDDIPDSLDNLIIDEQNEEIPASETPATDSSESIQPPIAIVNDIVRRADNSQSEIGEIISEQTDFEAFKEEVMEIFGIDIEESQEAQTPLNEAGEIAVDSENFDIQDENNTSNEAVISVEQKREVIKTVLRIVQESGFKIEKSKIIEIIQVVIEDYDEIEDIESFITQYLEEENRENTSDNDEEEIPLTPKIVFIYTAGYFLRDKQAA